MRKTYKPIARAERTAQVYRKKTLAVSDNFNIKQDDDKMENVDDYWSTAASVIGNETIDQIDDTVVSGQSDTLFNLNEIRRSVKNQKPKQNKRLTLKFDDKDVPVMIVPDNSTQVEVEQPMDVSGDEQSEEKHTTESAVIPEYRLMGSSPVEVSKKDEELTVENKEEVSAVFDVSDIINLSVTESETKENKEEENGKIMAKTRKFVKVRKPTSPRRAAPVKKAPTRSNRQDLEVISANERAVNNKVKALVCTKEIDTAVMCLNYMAYVNNEIADKTFSIFIVKGSVELEVERDKTVMKKGEATVITEGTTYSINSLSKNGSLLFLSYAL